MNNVLLEILENATVVYEDPEEVPSQVRWFFVKCWHSILLLLGRRLEVKVLDVKLFEKLFNGMKNHLGVNTMFGAKVGILEDWEKTSTTVWMLWGTKVLKGAEFPIVATRTGTPAVAFGIISRQGRPFWLVTSCSSHGQ